MKYPKNTPISLSQKQSNWQFLNTIPEKMSVMHNILNFLSDDEDEDFIPVLVGEDSIEDIDKEDYPELLPILPIRNTVLFPGVILPLTVGRQRSIKLVKKSFKGTRLVGAVTQKNLEADNPEKADIYQVGTVARLVKLISLPEGNLTAIIQGRKKFVIEEFVQEEPFLLAKVRYIEDETPNIKKKETKALMQTIKDSAFKILKLNPDIPQELQFALGNIENMTFLINFLSANINNEVGDKQLMLEINDLSLRGNKLLEYMSKEIQLLQLKQEINSRTHSDIDQQQRDYFLRQQMKVLQNELGGEGNEKEIDELRQKAEKKKWSEKIAKHFEKELDKLQRTNSASPDYPILLNYLEFLVELPWEHYTTDSFDLKKAKEILDKDHYGLDKVKNRIIEHLAVLKLRKDMKSPILCFYGPPGVGKTSLGKSIAKSLKRQYVRFSLGGMHDEAEIRGHRKTYIGAMPGRILQNIKKSGSSNPVFILDEIDKVGSDFRGDPSSALLEVLDPEQNNTFADNYLDLDYDLSKVMFIATANNLDTIQPALRDRMEIIEINGYTAEEKVLIAKKHLLPKLRKEHGLKANDFSITDEAIRLVTEAYTKESGVRNLEQKLAAVVRNIAKSIATEEKYNKKIKDEDVIRILGSPIFEKELYENNDDAGVVTGLAWTRVGGEILFIESSLSKGFGKLTLSGQLGDVMKESAMAALSYLKAHAEDWQIDNRIFSQYDLHIHVPEGAVPKDGPSAGITMLTSLASVFTQRKVRPHTAMTGELTLTGRVLPVGGIKEKILAAKRAGIKEIILSEKNRKDIEEIDKIYTQDLQVYYVKKAQEVLNMALLHEQVSQPIQFRFEEKPMAQA